MQSAVINFTTEEKTKQEAQKVAKKMGVSLSTVLNHYLKHFIRTQTIIISAQDEVPNEYLIQALIESEEDEKSGNMTSFENSQDAIDYLAAEIKHESKTHPH